jgi:hypothetical protein
MIICSHRYFIMTSSTLDYEEEIEQIDEEKCQARMGS